MQTVRTPAVAGLFYPADTAELHNQVQHFLSQVEPPVEPPPKAIIAPHAGYVYSGPIAASAYARLKAARGTIARVVLLGPSHRVGFRGVAVSGMVAFETPLGRIPVDQEAVELARQLPDVGFLEQAHAQAHSLEVHLPF
ncbi:MAG TPA: AmmeMemoRadiSam system protein B, partial [Candidatus Competibacter sp.]|nr:AmmeMemoRadiSam system protein B [Candidatus Competibacter sp.]